MRPAVGSCSVHSYCLGFALTLLTISIGPVRGDVLPIVADVDFQPLSAQVKRVLEALDMLGQPLLRADRERIERAIDGNDQKAAVRIIQEVFDRHCLIGIDINPESRVKSAQGPAPPRLVESGWTVFLVKVHNEAGVTAELQVSSPNGEPICIDCLRGMVRGGKPTENEP